MTVKVKKAVEEKNIQPLDSCLFVYMGVPSMLPSCHDRQFNQLHFNCQLKSDI